MKKIAFLIAVMLLTLSAISHSGEKQRITLTEAVKIALEKTSGEVISAELKKGVYEIKIMTEDGKIEKAYVEAEKGGVEVENRKRIPLDEATAIAVKDTPGEVVKVEFENDRYKIKIKAYEGGTAKIYVDAFSGEILKRMKRHYRYIEEFDEWTL